MLEFRELPDPVPGPGQVLVGVRATALNRADLLQRRGHYPPPPGEPESLGLECAGIVSAVGPGVSRVKEGDRVMLLLAGGGYADQVIADEGMCMPVPQWISLEEAAAIPEAFLTASEALFSVADLEPGETVLVHAAAGGVGSAAVQLAKLNRSRVLATTGTPEKVAAVELLGADRVVNYREEDFAQVAQQERFQPDVVIDFIGGPYWERHAKILQPRGRVVVLGLLGGREARVDLGRLLTKRQTLVGMVMRTRALAEKVAVTERFTERWLAAIAAGDLKPIVDSTFDWTDVAKAHERMEANANIGKIVLRVS